MKKRQWPWLKRGVSSVLSLAMLLSMFQLPAAAVDKTDVYLPETEMGTDILSSDVFYHEQDELARYRSHGCVCVEMESFALFHNARACGKQAACLLTISDSLISGAQTSAAQRERAFGQMMETALESAWMWQEDA